MTFLFGNPSRWGPVAKSFINGSVDDVVGLCETHREAEALRLLEVQRFPGRHSFWSPAVPLGEARTGTAEGWSNHGGICMATKASLGASTMGAIRGSDGWEPDLGVGRCWLAVLMARLPIALATLYLDDSVGMSMANVGRFAEVAQFAKACRRFLVVGGDFNVTPEELSRAFDFEEAGLVIVPPADVQATCTAGAGRLTSFFVVSAPLLGLVRSCEAVPVPWGTHLGVRLTLKTGLSQATYAGLSLPKSSPTTIFATLRTTRGWNSSWRLRSTAGS